MEIIDVTKECDDGRHLLRNLELLEAIVWHRVGRDLQSGVDLGHDAVTICRSFIEDPEIAKYTGGQIAYTFIIGEKGQIWQCLPLSDVGHHALRWSKPGVGVGFIGDFRGEDLDVQQWASGTVLSAELVEMLGLHPDNVVAHDELPHGSRDATKRCPGDHISMPNVRVAVSELMQGMAGQRLLAAGLVL